MEGEMEKWLKIISILREAKELSHTVKDDLLVYLIAVALLEAEEKATSAQTH
jgi:hypothetical protein